MGVSFYPKKDYYKLKNLLQDTTMDVKNFKQNLLNQLYEPYKKCIQCPLATLGRTNIVFGEGNPDAAIMFIGEGPGRDEDLLGRPFVGRSGKLLNHIFELVGINRSDVFITNIVKCRPPNNRAPLPEESGTCKKILLQKQIQIIRPQIICTLGSSALSNLIDKEVKISRLRGILITDQQIQILPTFHPAYILRNNKELPLFAKDIQTVFELSKKNE